MRVPFLLVVLAASLFYSYIAFAELAFLSSGVALVAFSCFCLFADWKLAREREAASPHWPTVLLIVVASGLLVLTLNLLGGLLAMAAFLLLCLSVLNRGHTVQNVAVSLAFPVAVFLLFDVLLNASVPEGLLPLPF
jgi:putative tricarboxylic transport membrane protein